MGGRGRGEGIGIHEKSHFFHTDVGEMKAGGGGSGEQAPFIT